jgi:hypothetical protein
VPVTVLGGYDVIENVAPQLGIAGRGRQLRSRLLASLQSSQQPGDRCEGHHHQELHQARCDSRPRQRRSRSRRERVSTSSAGSSSP